MRRELERLAERAFVWATSGVVAVCLGILGAQLSAQEAPPAPETPHIFSVEVNAMDTVFVRSELRDGELRAWDAEDREWMYDHDSGEFILSGESIGANHASRIRIYFDGEDTVRTDRDRPEDWAGEEIVVEGVSVEDVTIGARQFVRHSVVSTGKVRVDGLVDGDVTSTGEVTIGRTGWVEGNVTAPQIRVRSGGVVVGDQDESTPDIPSIGFDGSEISFDAEPTMIFMIIAIAFLLVGFVALSIAPEPLGRITGAIGLAPWLSVVLGFASVFLVPIAIVVMAVTLIGIPLAIITVALYPLAMLVGLAASLQRGGQILLEAYGKVRGTQTRQLIVGAGSLLGLWTLAITLVNTTSSALEGWGIFLMVVGGMFSAPAFFAGIGGIILTKGGRKPYVPGQHRGLGAPPPPTPPPMPAFTGAQAMMHPMPPAPPTIPGRLSSPQSPDGPDSTRTSS